MFAQFVDAMRRRGISPKTILDVGACDGSHSLQFAATFPAAQVHAFEAHPQFFATLKRNVAASPSITPHHAAVGDTDGRAGFWAIDTSSGAIDPGASSLLRASGRFDDHMKMPQRELEVPATRLDSWADRVGVESFDAVWMDLQGAELLALAGMGELLDGVQMMVLEVLYDHIYVDQPLYDDVDRYLLDRGFACIGHQPCLEGWYGDAIYVRREAAPRAKAAHDDFVGRIAEVLADPCNRFLPRADRAGRTIDGLTVMHNGLEVAAMPGFYGEVLKSARGLHEPQQEYVFGQLLPEMPPSATMLELGAYWSFYSLWFAKTVPGARCYLVEADHGHLELARKNFRRCGVEATYLVEAAAPNGLTVDALMESRGLDQLDLLHADIDGGEYDMLQGAAAALDAGRIHTLFVSTHSQELHVCCRDHLTDRNYQVIAEADFDFGTSSFDGLVVAQHGRIARDPILLPQRARNGCPV